MHPFIVGTNDDASEMSVKFVNTGLYIFTYKSKMLILNAVGKNSNSYHCNILVQGSPTPGCPLGLKF